MLEYCVSWLASVHSDDTSNARCSDNRWISTSASEEKEEENTLNYYVTAFNRNSKSLFNIKTTYNSSTVNIKSSLNCLSFIDINRLL